MKKIVFRGGEWKLSQGPLVDPEDSHGRLL